MHYLLEVNGAWPSVHEYAQTWWFMGPTTRTGKRGHGLEGQTDTDRNLRSTEYQVVCKVSALGMQGIVEIK